MLNLFLININIINIFYLALFLYDSHIERCRKREWIRFWWKKPNHNFLIKSVPTPIWVDVFWHLAEANFPLVDIFSKTQPSVFIPHSNKNTFSSVLNYLSFVKLIYFFLKINIINLSLLMIKWLNWKFMILKNFIFFKEIN